ncbi:MAG TPA: prolyl oligopeptidase family serine peptidase [Verrucomicrobiae bacterium]|nr:prolyl oligopeptidase family serine peptidase [Verrucomicrobiae bacterium]
MKKLLALTAFVALVAAPTVAIVRAAGAFAYPAAPRGDVTDNYFGTTVPDPYRWLENIDSPQTVAWETAEQKLTRSYLDAIPARDTIANHLRTIANYARYSAPSRYKNRYFYTHNSGLQNQSVLYTMVGAHGKPYVLIDPNTFSKDGTIALSDTSVSWNAGYMAYATQTAGSDWQNWRVRDLATNRDLSDNLVWAKFSTAAWFTDNKSFLYERYPTPPSGLTYKGALYNQKAYLHRLGTPESADTLFYARPDHKDWFLGPSTTMDGRYVVMSISGGDSINNRLGYIDLRDPKHAMHELFWKNDAIYSYVDNIGSTFYIQTTLDAPNGRVIAVDLQHLDHPRTIVREARFALQSVGTAGHRMFLSYLADAHSAVRVVNYRGRVIRDVAFPAGLGDASGFSGWPHDTSVYYSYSGWTTPPTIFSYNIATGRSTVYLRPKIHFDASNYTTKEIFYASKDGTRVPMMISYRKGIALDGSHPTILYGYGGFDIPMTPYFSTFLETWMQMGGIYAVANIRGGSEYGEAWHRGGMRQNKQRVFDDFIAGAQYLIDQKYTSTPKLAIKGESNGGLLMGAAETQRPDLFGAVLAGVGVMDMLRFDKFTIGNAWIPEYGCSTCSASQFKTLYAYSPYANVKPGVAYPPTLVLTADHDDRVFPAHSLKFAAAMQNAQSGDAPILLRVESKAGHGHGMSISQNIDEYADMYAFLVKNLGMTLPSTFK